MQKVIRVESSSLGRGHVGFRWALLLCFWSSLPAGAHQLNASFTTLIIRPDTLRLVISIDEHELLTKFELDENQDGVLWREEIIAGIPAVFAYVEEKVAVKVDGKPLPLKRVKGDVQPDNQGNMFMRLMFSTELDGLPAEVELEVDFFSRFGDDHKNLARIIQLDKPLVQAVFAPENRRQVFTFSEPEGSWFDQLRKYYRQLLK